MLRADRRTGRRELQTGAHPTVGRAGRTELSAPRVLPRLRAVKSPHPTRPAASPTGVVTLRIPASTSNLGSGFDTLGLALRWHGFVRLKRLPAARPSAIGRVPESVDAAAARVMVQEAARSFFRRTGRERFGFVCDEWGPVPVARGLGASALLRLGVVAGLNELAGAGLTRADLLQLVTDLEGHPDNAAPALFGGFTVSGRIGDAVQCHRFRVSPKLKFVTLIPEFGIDTGQARRLLPRAYPRVVAMHALNRAALITAAFGSGNYEALRGVFDDRVHQPTREALVPQLRNVICAGEQAGALGGFLSGSGSAIICVTLRGANAVARAMRGQMPGSITKILTADNEAFKVMRASRHRRP